MTIVDKQFGLSIILNMERISPKKLMRIADTLRDRGYYLGHEIGEGTYSHIRNVERAQDGEMCAVKIIDVSKVKKEYLRTFMPKELEIILTLKHKNVVRTYEVIKSGEFVFHVMQYARNGDVLQQISKNGYIPEERAKCLFRDISNGIKYLHDLNIVHRDLKCENILVLNDNSAVVSDFGFVRHFDDVNGEDLSKTFCGSYAYASPEVLRRIPYDPKISDIWSMGIILFTMMCGSMPFDDTNITRMVERQINKEIVFPNRVDELLTKLCKSFIRRLLEPDINARITIKAILYSSWLRSVKCP